jgi:hypothetical protein
MTEQDRGQLIPFDQEAVVEALRLVKGLPGYLLALLSRVMEHAVRGNWSVIDQDRIREVYKQGPPMPVETDDIRSALPPAQVDLRTEE